jgi:hypothetical protein
MRRWTHTRDIARARALLPAILPSIPSQAGALPAALWRVQRAERTESGLVVVVLGPDDAPATAVVKLARTAEGVTCLRQQVQALGALRAEARLGPWSSLLSGLLATGSVGGGLVSQTITAVVLLATRLRPLWSSRLRDEGLERG